MRSITLKSSNVASLILISVLLSSMLTAIFVGATGEVTITEDTLLLTDGSNPMVGDFNMSEYQIIDGVFHKGATPPPSPSTGQWFYDTDNYILYIYNGTDWSPSSSGSQGPTGEAGAVQGLPYSYLVFTNVTSTYMVNGTTGIIDWNSSDSDVIVDAVIANCSVGDLIVVCSTVNYGTITVDVDAFLLIRNAGESVTEGQTLYYNMTDSEAYKAKADSVTTIGNGNDVYLCMWNSTDGSKTLLLENGYVANSGWSWSAGNTLWVSNATAGSMIVNYPSDSGDQALQVGTAYSATAIHFASSKVVIEIA